MEQAQFTQIITEVKGEIAYLVLNSPQTINALSRTMIAEITSALNWFGANRSVKVLIVKANGKHFCSGHNLKEMVGVGVSEGKDIFAACTRMMQLIHDIPQIVIAQVHGIATAAGCQLTAQCDLAVATETARFATPGVRIGLFCTTPMVVLSRVVGRKKAMEMLMTGRMISAAEAERAGLVNTVVPEADLEKATLELAETICNASPFVLELGKRAFYDQIDQPEVKAYHYANNVMGVNVMAEDAREGISAFIEKRKPTWQGR